MFTNLFYSLREAKVPISLREYLTLLEAMEKQVAVWDVEEFYFLARSTLVKDERNIDKFDRVFAQVFKGLEAVSGTEAVNEQAIPEEWLRRMADKHLTDEEKAQIEALGGFEKLMETLKKRLEEQEKRHQGGSKWIGTGGTSPFGAGGYNPEGVRIGQKEGRHGRAVKIWDKRTFRDLDDTIELGTRNIKVALKRLRRWAREGEADEFDLSGTIRATAENGYLDVKTRPERRNAVKLLLFLDVGGSMDGYIRQVEELFSAARAEFKHMEFFYFHNCLYEGVWRESSRRWGQQMDTWDVLRTYGPTYKCIFVGDAAMSPYEIVYPGGAVEHWNAEAGEVWLRRALDQWPSTVWLNPVPEKGWRYTQSTALIKDLFDQRMYPLTLSGIGDAMKELTR
ncbi:MAG: VWA domain-containing protein [Pseudomonadota bacterium]